MDWQAIVIQPPVKKTTFTSEVSRQKTSAPLVFDTRSDKFFSFCRWAPPSNEIDLVSQSEWHHIPAFRLGGPNSSALSRENVRAAIHRVAQGAIPNWEQFDYGNESLHIGLNKSWRAT